ncbi:2OGFeDO, oxygenase domain containing protein [uncultured Caudovirales phage]|uniref:2OGFeDO, oxygenase domain containing protein n=1 Tax=uncultured Caudovirales phage TaxID=2100421 RepID=A0A6J5P0M0_9CAUD|nr:2OGFeDO, oxygenase domain containing protein [uncultured Caudovirales phage]
MVKVIVARDKLECEHLLGHFVDESHYDIVIEEDTDCFQAPSCDVTQKALCGMATCESCDSGNEELRIAFKFRKNYFSKEEQKLAYEGLRLAATESQNRGLAAGPRGEMLNTEGRGGRDWVTPYQLEVLDFLIDQEASLFNDVSISTIRKKYENYKPSENDETRGQVWLRGEVTKVYPEYHGWFDKWIDGLDNKSPEMVREEALNIINNWISTTNYAKSVFSGVAGWYDRYPRIPYGRATSYTEKNPELFKKSYPFLQSLNKGFKDLLPWRWNNQKQAADKIDSRFLVPETVFTTITVNKSFRTACHRDAGDLDSGLSNLLVLGDGEYTGGYLVFPEYRIAVNVRPGDLLLVNNHEVIHGNTPIVLNHENAERISVVCYFREAMLELKSYEYEALRKQYVDERRLNKNHKFWRPLWNGVSPNMWGDQEWYAYLHKHNMKDPYGKDEKADLGDWI